jgi:hypothetical protein
MPAAAKPSNRPLRLSSYGMGFVPCLELTKSDGLSSLAARGVVIIVNHAFCRLCDQAWQ